MNNPVQNKLRTIRGEIALLIVVLFNSFGVALMLYSGAGISAISSVPYAFHEVIPVLSLGTWTYIFQGFLILSLFFMRKKIVFPYLLSFAVGFVFSLWLDLHESWIHVLPKSLSLNTFYFCLSYLVLSFGIALSNRCKMPIVPTDLFPRELSLITGIMYSKIKIPFDVICLIITTVITFIFLGHIEGLGIGTVLAAFTMGKAVSIWGKWLDKNFVFVSILESNTLSNQKRAKDFKQYN